MIEILGMPIDFILFGITLLGVAFFHRHTLPVALAGLAAITTYKLAFTGFKDGSGFAGFGQHMQHEWVILANLFLLLMGFALLSRHFEKSGVPDEMPRSASRRLEGRLDAARHDLRALSFPRQHRRGSDRWNSGAARVRGQSPHRLSGRHRSGVERRRRRQRDRRHDNHNDVDRWCEPAQRRSRHTLQRPLRCSSSPFRQQFSSNAFRRL